MRDAVCRAGEAECGHHYARSMASWAVLLALSGFSCNVAEGRIGFAPRIFADNFRCFWSVGAAWGTYSQRFKRAGRTAALQVEYGELSLGELVIQPGAPRPKSCRAVAAAREIPAVLARDGKALKIAFAEPLRVAAGESLKITLG